MPLDPHWQASVASDLFPQGVSGEALSFGRGDSGQLGTSDGIDLWSPTRIFSGDMSSVSFVASATNAHTLLLGSFPHHPAPFSFLVFGCNTIRISQLHVQVRWAACTPPVLELVSLFGPMIALPVCRAAGQLGHGDSWSSQTPTLVRGHLSTLSIVSVAAGESFSVVTG